MVDEYDVNNANSGVNVMDPVITFAIGHAAGKAVDQFATAIRHHVVERWSRHRASEFLDEFYFEVERELDGKQSSDLGLKLDQLLEDELSSELIFEAYRRVALSRSKVIGPRVIAILTAKIVLGHRSATHAEQSMMDAAELLDDDELVEFASFIREYRGRAEAKDDTKVSLCDRGILRVQWYSEQFDSVWNREFNLTISPLNLHESCGSWAVKLERLGIIQTEMTERKWEYKEDGERHVDWDGSVREISWWIVSWDTYFSFAELIERLDTDRRARGRSV